MNAHPPGARGNALLALAHLSQHQDCSSVIGAQVSPPAHTPLSICINIYIYMCVCVCVCVFVCLWGGRWGGGAHRSGALDFIDLV